MIVRTTGRDLAREFLNYIQVEKGLSANTVQSYARDITRLQTWAEQKNKHFAELERKYIRRFGIKRRMAFIC